MKQKENLFEYLARKQRENENKKENFVNKYWKLSSTERMDYDLKVDRIKKECGYGFLPLTVLLIKICIFIMLFIGVCYLSEELIWIFYMGIKLLFMTFQFIGLTFGIDLVMMFFVYNSLEKRKIKELNKRFKLI